MKAGVGGRESKLILSVHLFGCGRGNNLFKPWKCACSSQVAARLVIPAAGAQNVQLFPEILAFRYTHCWAALLLAAPR